MAAQAPHVVMVPTPGMGHLIPLIQLASRIIKAHNLTISFVIPTEGPPSKAQKEALEALPSAQADYFFLPPVNLDDQPQDTKVETKISLTLVRSLPALKSRLEDMASSRNLAVLVVDLFGTDAFDICPEFGMKPYIFYPTTAMCLSLFLHLHELDTRVSCEYRDMDEPVLIPGCIPVQGKDLLSPTQDRTNDAYKWLLHHSKRYRLAEGIMVNSFMELEEGPIKALQESRPGYPPVYPVGPLVRCGSSEGGDEYCLKWLDEQPRGSVLFVSFGSAGTLSKDQLIELAHGLEMTQQRFIWAVRSPNEKVANATYFASNAKVEEEKERESLEFLPKGFLERTKERGLVIPSWAPQLKILSHVATGGFLTHCGWNSTLESIVHGVPLIAWPLFAEQRMNALMLTQALKVALWPMPSENGLVGRHQIATAVLGLLEGEQGKEIRNRIKDLKNAAAQVLGHHGSSTNALSQVVQKWRSY